MIKTSYDPETDVLHVIFGADDARYDGAQEVAPGVYLEIDTMGRAMGIEVTSASKQSAAAVSEHVQAA